MRIVPWALLVLLFSCDEAERDAPIAAPPPFASATSKPAPMGAVSLPDMDSCMRGCVEQSKMKAVGADQIDAGCRTSCRNECETACDRPGQPAGFADKCKSDCGKQLESLTPN